MILIGLGANLPSETWGLPQNTLQAALASLAGRGVEVASLSPFYLTAPVPVSDQPDFVNAVAALKTKLPPEALMALLHEVENEFGRIRGARFAARVIDLDLLAYGALLRPEAGSDKVGGEQLILPHPRLHLRHFVLVPLVDIAPNWRHPLLGRTASQLLADLGDTADVRPMAGQA